MQGRPGPVAGASLPVVLGPAQAQFFQPNESSDGFCRVMKPSFLDEPGCQEFFHLAPDASRSVARVAPVYNRLRKLVIFAFIPHLLSWFCLARSVSEEVSHDNRGRWSRTIV